MSRSISASIVSRSSTPASFNSAARAGVALFARNSTGSLIGAVEAEADAGFQLRLVFVMEWGVAATFFFHEAKSFCLVEEFDFACAGWARIAESRALDSAIGRAQF